MLWERRAVLVVAMAGVVHAAFSGAGLAQHAKPKGGAGTPQAKSPKAERSSQGLPAPVAEMREAILTAVRSGQIEDLRYAIELNEIKPDFGAPAGTDPIAHLRSLSTDPRGIDILAVLSLILDTPPAVVRAGRDIENSAVYVWPDISELPVDKLTPGQEVVLTRLAGPDVAKAMRAAKAWLWWRLAIGADGTWHTFSR